MVGDSPGAVAAKDPRRRATRTETTAALARFDVEGRLVSLLPHAAGLINESWVATLETPAGARRFLLQRINRHVFPRPEQVMANMMRITRHLAARLAGDGIADIHRRVLTVVATREGAPFHVDAVGETWRLVRWIEGARSAGRADTAGRACEAARAFGRFLRLLADLPGPRLHEVVPGFHDTPARLAALERVVAADPAGRAGSCRAEVAALLDRRPLAFAIADRVAGGELVVRPVHNDAKIANVLRDEVTGEALAVVDLDTVMPGLALHDFGDLVRSTVSDSAEDETDPCRVVVRVPVFEALARGFAEGAGDALSPLERSLLATAAEVITYEQALRFLTDHLDGDRYYRIERPGHNLDRARAQLRLLESLEEARPALSRSLLAAPR
jgi:Ser/Thr protein kinase RdoA (MazF antagonist)